MVRSPLSLGILAGSLAFTLGCAGILGGSDDKSSGHDSGSSGLGGLIGDGDGTDADGDGFSDDDCDDDDADVNPDADDEVGNDEDENCDGVDGVDADEDGTASENSGGDDCDDHDNDIGPDEDEVWYDGIDQDCDGGDDYDQDGDGAAAFDYDGTDCDDEDASVHPGAYDRPNDGIDQDCDYEDRSFDGTVLDEGVTSETTLSFAIEPGQDGYDIAFLLDTTCSMTTWMSALEVSAIGARLPSSFGAIHAAFATFDDYAFTGMGVVGTDLPFQLRQQLTEDEFDVQYEIDATTVHNGGDGPESVMEALYQTLTGAGYDQDCDRSLDVTTDVPPFIADGSDAFSGRATGTYSSSVTGTGDLGGVGFRAAGIPIVVYITDNLLRDPEAASSSYNATPEGCSIDAAGSDVAAAAADLGAWLIGIPVGSTLPVAQMNALSADLGQYVDSDGDGKADDVPVYSVSTASLLNAAIATALADVAEVAPLSSVYALVTLEVVSDPEGVVSDISPASYTDVDRESTSTLDFDITWLGAATDGSAITTSVTFALVADGETIETRTMDVEVAPR